MFLIPDIYYLDFMIFKKKSTLRKILEMSINKGLNEKDIQVLAPLYKGENGIDLLNLMIRDIFNPGKKNMIKLGDVYYAEIKLDDLTGETYNLNK